MKKTNTRKIPHPQSLPSWCLLAPKVYLLSRLSNHHLDQGRRVYLRRRLGPNLTTIPHHGDAIGHLIDLRQVMGDIDDRNTPLF